MSSLVKALLDRTPCNFSGLRGTSLTTALRRNHICPAPLRSVAGDENKDSATFAAGKDNVRPTQTGGARRACRVPLRDFKPHRNTRSFESAPSFSALCRAPYDFMNAPIPSLPAATLAESPVAASPAFTRGQVLRVLSGVLLCMLLSAIDQNVVVPAVPAIAADLDSYGHLAWIVSAYLLTSTAATPIYGKLSDLYGRRTLLLPAIVWFVFASVLCGFARSLPPARRFPGAAGDRRGRTARHGPGVDRRRRRPARARPIPGLYFGRVGRRQHRRPGARRLGHRRRLVAVDLLVERADRRRRLRAERSRLEDAEGAPARGARRLCRRSAADDRHHLPAADPELGRRHISDELSSTPILALALVTGLTFAALFVQERSAPEPLLPPRLLRSPVVSLAVAAGFLATACIFAAAFLLPLQFQLLHGASASDAGSLIVPFLGGVIVGAFLAGEAGRAGSAAARG